MFAAGESATEARETVERPSIEYNAAELRDPFRNALKTQEQVFAPASETSTQVSPPNLSIQGIVWGGGVSSAIINNKVVKTGDSIEEAKVISIDRDGVVVLYNNKEYSFSSPAKANKLETMQKKPEGRGI